MSGRPAMSDGRGMSARTTGLELRLDATACRGHGICAAAAPGLIRLDEWGYPVLASGDLDQSQVAEARRAADLCPALALRLHRSS